MSGAINTTILRDKNGVMVSMIDQTARDGVAANATEIGKLTEEIEVLKTPSESVTVTRNGAVVTFDGCVKDEKITVEGDAADGVTLVQNSKNFAPYIPSGQNGTELVYAPLDNGKFSLRGKATSEHWVYFWHPTVGTVRNKLLPAGTYTIHTDLECTVNSKAVGGFVIRSWDTESTTGGGAYLANNVDKNRPGHFMLDKPTWCSFALTWGEPSPAYDGAFYVQIERGSTATDFVKAVRNEYSAAYPVALDAFDGTNIIFDNAGTMLAATYTEGYAIGGISVAAINKIVDERIALDPAPYGLPILRLTGDNSAMTKDNAVDLAYTCGGMSGTASVKWQGSSSLAYPKKNYTITFDQAFEAKDGWGAQKKYCLKANYIDHSHARNLMCASIWGDLVKSAVTSDDFRYSLPNGGAVDGFPCIIMINEEFHGLYTLNIPKDAWMLGMGSGTQECILCARGKTQPNADGFKTLETALGTAFDVEYITDENNTDWALTSLNRMLSAIINSDGSDLDTTIAQYLDWDSVIDHYIQTVLTGAADCTYRNYLLSTRDGVKWFFTGYDMDSTFGLYWDGKSFMLANEHPTFASYADVHRAMELVKTYKKDALKARYNALRAGALSEINITNKLTNYTACIPSQVLDADAAKWPTIPSTSASNIAQMLNWYRLRVAVADAEINAL